MPREFLQRSYWLSVSINLAQTELLQKGLRWPPKVGLNLPVFSKGVGNIKNTEIQPYKRMMTLAYGQLGRLTARFFNVLASLHFQSALQVAPYSNRYMS